MQSTQCLLALFVVGQYPAHQGSVGRGMIGIELRHSRSGRFNETHQPYLCVPPMCRGCLGHLADLVSMSNGRTVESLLLR